MTTLLHPRDLNLPAEFPSWRPGQFEAIMDTIDAFDTLPFVASNDPTGTGKSVKAVALSQLMGVRSVILTSTKALQDQYADDFRTTGISDVRGRINYPCPSYGNCAEGRLMGCTANKEDDCQYVNDLSRFLQSPLGVTNYAYYLSSRIHSDGIGATGLLVLDEAHNAVQELCDALEIHLSHSKAAPFYAGAIPEPPRGQSLQAWIKWAGACVPLMEKCIKNLKSANRKLLLQADSLAKDLARLAAIPEDWILDDSSTKETIFAPLWPTEHAKSLLFSKCDRVLLMSATIVPKTLSLLNIQESESKFLSSAYSFSTSKSPIYLFGAHKISHRTTEDEFSIQLGRMDSLISQRLDRKGIIHSVSYDRQQFIYSRSQYRSIMLAPRPSELASAIETFRESPAPKILVSPAITTGYDFPGTDAEYQFIVKIPFLDLRGPIMKARNDDDPEYSMYLTVQTLVQMCGRLMRGPDDSSETFILDKNINWLLLPPERDGKYRHLFPSWFLRLVQYPKYQPIPLPKLA